MPRLNVQLAPGTDIGEDGKDDTQENDDGDGPKEAKPPRFRFRRSRHRHRGCRLRGCGRGLRRRRRRGRRFRGWRCRFRRRRGPRRRGRGRRGRGRGRRRGCHRWDRRGRWLRGWRGRGFRRGVAVGTGVGVDVGAGGGPTRNCVWPPMVRSWRSAFLMTPVKVYCPSWWGRRRCSEAGVAKQVEERTSCPSSTGNPGVVEADEGEAVRQRLLHLPEGAVVAGGDGDPELAAGRGPGPLEGPAALCACASTTPGGVSSAMAPTMAANARAANAPKEIRINSSSCLLAPCGGLRYYAK